MLKEKLYLLDSIEIRYSKSSKGWLVDFQDCTHFLIGASMFCKTQKQAIEYAKSIDKKVPIYVYKQNDSLKEILIRI